MARRPALCLRALSRAASTSSGHEGLASEMTYEAREVRRSAWARPNNAPANETPVDSQLQKEQCMKIVATVVWFYCQALLRIEEQVDPGPRPV